MKRTGKALWMIYAVVLCFCFFQTTAAISALLGFSQGQYVLLSGGLLAGFVLFAVLPIRLFLIRKKTGRYIGKRNGGIRRRHRRGVSLTAVCGAAVCFAAVLLIVRLLRIPEGGMYLGQHSRAVFWWNLICQIGGSMLAFAALFALSGFWSAVFMITGVIVLSPLSTGIYVADPQNFLFFLAGAELFCIMRVCWVFQNPRGRGKDAFVLLSCGLLCGLLCLADLRLCAFLTLPAGEALCGKKVRCARMRYRGLCIFWIVSFAGFLGGAAVWGVRLGKAHDFFRDLAAFLESWFLMTKTRSFPVMLHSPLLSEYITALVCYLAAFLPLFFDRSQKTRQAVRWIVPFLLLFIMEQAASVGLQGQALRFLTLSAMAGAAVTGIFVCREPTAVGVIMKRKTSVLENSPGPAVPGEYLDNPLPVPKRHVRKEMNYGFEPAPEQMYYEVPVADNDDFDV